MTEVVKRSEAADQQQADNDDDRRSGERRRQRDECWRSQRSRQHIAEPVMPRMGGAANLQPSAPTAVAKVIRPTETGRGRITEQQRHQERVAHSDPEQQRTAEAQAERRGGAEFRPGWVSGDCARRSRPAVPRPRGAAPGRRRSGAGSALRLWSQRRTWRSESNQHQTAASAARALAADVRHEKRRHDKSGSDGNVDPEDQGQLA